MVIFAGIPFTFLYNLLSGWLRSLGDSKTPLFFLVLSSVLNVILDLAFILIFKLGVFGASLATVLSQAISGMLCLLFIAVKVPILHITREEWRPQSKRMVELCAYGVPMGLAIFHYGNRQRDFAGRSQFAWLSVRCSGDGGQ